MTAIALALASAALGGTANFIGGALARRVAVVHVVAVAQALALLLLCPLILWQAAWDVSPEHLSLAIPAGLAIALGMATFYSAMSKGGAGIAAPFASLGVCVPIAWGLTTGHMPAMMQLAGIGLAVVGGVALGAAPSAAPATRQTILSAAIAGLGFGAALLLYTKAAERNVLMTLFVMKATVVVVFAARNIEHRAAPTLRTTFILPVLLLAITDIASNLTLAMAVRHGNLAVVAALASLYPAATLFWARYLDRERFGPLRLTSIVLVLLGVVLIAADQP